MSNGTTILPLTIEPGFSPIDHVDMQMHHQSQCDSCLIMEATI